MQAFKREELVGVALQLLVAGLVAQPGLGVGVGYLDQGAGIEVRAELGLVEKDWKLRLAVPVRYLLTPDPKLRQSDWDQLGDFSSVLESLEWVRDQFELRGGRLVLSAGHGSIIDGYRAGGHPDHAAAGLSGVWRSPRVAVEVALDRVTDPSLVFSHLRYALRALDQTSTWIPSVAATVAIDPDPAAPQERGLDGRLGLDVESLWRWRDHRVGLYLDAVMGLGPAWAARHRLHGGVLATWFERQWRLNLRLETRRSPDGLPAGPYDNLYALFRHEQHFVRPPASDALGFGANVTLRHVEGHGLTLRASSDPFGDESMERLEGRLNWTVAQRGALYVAAGRWETGREPPSWYAQGEGRLQITKGLAAWLKLRRMRRMLGGIEEPVVDVMVGLSGALAIRAR